MPDLSEKISANVLEAQVFSRKHLVLELDFSLGSLEELETHIDTVEYAIPGGKSADNVARLTRIWGTYLGECLRRSAGGDWVDEASDDNEGIALRVHGQTVFPLERVRQRLLEGEAFNLVSFFKEHQAAP
jgi:hypothetical protein